ncbi:hypothetical protein COOONC_01195, partial [Cooperia oncophora]
LNPSRKKGRESAVSSPISTGSANSDSSPAKESPTKKTSSPEKEASESIKESADSAASKEAADDQTSNSRPLSAPNTEISEDHNDSANMSDSGNGTVTPDCEVAPDGRRVQQKPNNGFREVSQQHKPFCCSFEVQCVRACEIIEEIIEPLKEVLFKGPVSSLLLLI